MILWPYIYTSVNPSHPRQALLNDTVEMLVDCDRASSQGLVELLADCDKVLVHEPLESYDRALLHEPNRANCDGSLLHVPARLLANCDRALLHESVKLLANCDTALLQEPFGLLADCDRATSINKSIYREPFL